MLALGLNQPLPPALVIIITLISIVTAVPIVTIIVPIIIIIIVSPVAIIVVGEGLCSAMATQTGRGAGVGDVWMAEADGQDEYNEDEDQWEGSKFESKG